jgi:hypothetical protein
VRTAGRFLPWKKTAKTSNVLDPDANRRYQWSDSLQEGSNPGWRGRWALAKAHQLVPSSSHFVLLQFNANFHWLSLIASENFRLDSFSVYGNQAIPKLNFEKRMLIDSIESSILTGRQIIGK